MKHNITFIVCIINVFFMFHDGGMANGCVTCSDAASTFGTLLGSFLNIKVTKTTNRHQKIHTIKCPTAPTKTKVDGTKECTVPPTIKSDIVELFGSLETLTNLTLSEKKTAISVFTSYYNSSSSIRRLPACVAVNMAILFGTTNKLFWYCVSEKILGTVLDIVTVNGTLRRAPDDVQALFLDGYFGLSPAAYVKNCVSENSSRSLLETVSTAENLNSLSRTSVVNLITGITLWNAFPAENLKSLLAFIADDPTNIFLQLPPSTVFGFVEGLLGVLNGPESKLQVPNSVISTIIRSIMTFRMLSMLPRSTFHRFISVLGNNPALTSSLQVTDFHCLLRTLKTSPVLLTSVDPLQLASILTTVATTPTIYKNVNATLWTGTMQSISDYVPSAIGFIPANVRTSLGLKKTGSQVCAKR